MEHQYSLKWNNHPNNISSVFTKLRNEELFVDVTLASADRQIIRGHRVVLSAGSGYLERILAMNPSEHPTIVLTNLKYRELRLLVDFMYSGEISVDQPVLGGLLEAANWLQIKGLYEGAADNSASPGEEEGMHPPDVTSSHDEEERNLSPVSEEGTQRSGKRARSRSASPVPAIAGVQPPNKVSKPLYGLANTGWIVDSVNDKEDVVVKPDKDLQDIPSLLNLANHPNFLQQFKPDSPCKPMVDPSINDQMMQAMQLCGTSYLSQLAALQTCGASQPKKPITSPSFTGSFTSFATNAHTPSSGGGGGSGLKLGGLLTSAPVRRYKQYTEDSLQAALKEIMEGQSINRSSMKHNIPARTLRDWMKRLNIKSVYTHHASKDKEGSVGSTSPEPDMNLSLAERIRNLVAGNGSSAAPSINTSGEMDEEESEALKIDESCQNLGSMAEMAA